MTTPTLHATMSDTAHHSQGAFAHAVQVWADSVQKFICSAPTMDAKMTSAKEVVDNYFDVVEHMLATQRELTKNFMSVTQHAAKDMQHVAKDMQYVAKDMQHAVKDMQDGVQEPAPRKS